MEEEHPQFPISWSERQSGDKVPSNLQNIALLLTFFCAGSNEMLLNQSDAEESLWQGGCFCKGRTILY
jgi:hypothetical protein